MKIKIDPLSAISFALLFVAHPLSFSAMLVCATLHELGHLLAARLLGIGFSSLSLSHLGAALTPTQAMGSYREELLVAAAGPFVNLLSTLLVPPTAEKGFCFFFLLASRFLAILNLLPLKSFDGGRILLCLLSHIGKPRLGERILCVTTFVFLFALWSFSAYLLLRIGTSLSLFVFSCSLFCRLFVNLSASQDR